MVTVQLVQHCRASGRCCHDRGSGHRNARIDPRSDILDGNWSNVVRDGRNKPSWRPVSGPVERLEVTVHGVVPRNLRPARDTGFDVVGEWPRDCRLANGRQGNMDGRAHDAHNAPS